MAIGILPRMPGLRSDSERVSVHANPIGRLVGNGGIVHTPVTARSPNQTNAMINPANGQANSPKKSQTPGKILPFFVCVCLPGFGNI